MNKVIHDLGREALRQLFGLQQPRGGKIVLTRHAARKMTEHKLDRGTLENAFRHGRKGQGGKIIHIPTDLVVAQEASDVESSSRLDFLLLHNL